MLVKQTNNESEKQMNVEAFTKVAEQFKAELAGQYNLPELRDVQFAVTEHDEQKPRLVFKTPDVAVAPTGQLAGIVSQLSVRVELWTDGNFTKGELRYNYQHHSLGSNGNEQRFAVITETRFGRDDVRYMGKISEGLAYRYSNQLHEARTAAEAAKK